jgi:hypothetical protein
MTRTYEIKEYDIVITVDEDGNGNGSLEGTLCLSVGDEPADEPVNLSIHALESMILAHACEGIDVSSPAYVRGIETALDAVLNNCDL